MKNILIIIGSILLLSCNDLTASTTNYSQLIGLECNRKVLSLSVAQGSFTVLSRPMKADDTEEVLWGDIHNSGSISRYVIRESRCK